MRPAVGLGESGQEAGCRYRTGTFLAYVLYIGEGAVYLRLVNIPERQPPASVTSALTRSQ